MTLPISQPTTNVTASTPAFPVNSNQELTAQPSDASKLSSKGRILSKDAPVIVPITPLTPVPADDTVNIIAVIAAMMVAVQAMELCISKLMSNVTGYESQMSIEAAKASEISQEKNISNAQKVEEKQREEAERSGIMKIFGYIAAALTCVVSAGTLSLVAASLIIAVTALDTFGVLQDGIDKFLDECGVDPNSTLGAALSAAIKIIVIVVASLGTGAAQAAAKGTEATAEGAEAAANLAKVARNMQFAGMLGTLNPLGDLGVAVVRAANGGKEDPDIEAWVQMSTAIFSAFVGMAAMFTAMKGMAAAGDTVGNSVMMEKAISATGKLAVVISLVGAALGIDVGVLKIEQSEIEKKMGGVAMITLELKSLVEILQSISQDQQQWMKQNTDTDRQLSDSFNYDENANFAQVQLHG